MSSERRERVRQFLVRQGSQLRAARRRHPGLPCRSHHRIEPAAIEKRHRGRPLQRRLFDKPAELGIVGVIVSRLALIFVVAVGHVFNLLNAVSAKFKAGGFVELGPLRHVTGALLQYASEGLHSETLDDILRIAKENVGKLAPEQLISDARPMFGEPNDFAGLEYMARRTIEFMEFNVHVQLAFNAATQAARPKEASVLLATMVADSAEFSRQLISTDRGASRFWNVPILANFAPSAFAKGFLGLETSARFTVARTLQSRYGHTQADLPLDTERPWLAEVARRTREEATSRAGRMSGSTLGSLAGVLEQSLAGLEERKAQRDRDAALAEQLPRRRWERLPNEAKPLPEINGTDAGPATEGSLLPPTSK